MESPVSKRKMTVESVRDSIMTAYKRFAVAREGHVLVCDLRDVDARAIMNVLAERFNQYDFAVPDDAQNRVQIVCVTAKNFKLIADVNHSGFEFQAGHFGVLYYGFGGSYLTWFKIPLFEDGSHKFGVS